MFGPEVMILGGGHDYKYTLGHIRHKTSPVEKKSSIVIENGVWVGARAIILDGAVVSEGAVIGAGEVIRDTVPPYCVYADGKVRPRFKTEEELKTLLNNVGSKYSVREVSDFILQWKNR